MDVENAIREWTSLLGRERVVASDDVKDEYSRSTQQYRTRPDAVLYPKSTSEVSALVAVAQKYGVPLYPISRGNNWGYGDACAVTDHQVIVDLRHMNRILEVNERLAYAVVEPGVTQQQLHDYMVEHDIALWPDVTGAGPDASIVGNTIERGFGHTPCGDHFHMSAGYEVVLADGHVLKTGFGHYKNSQSTYLFKSGLGPSLDGLFTQSNLGIITKMGVWLVPKPECLEAFAFSVKNDDDIRAVVDALRPLRLSGLLQSTIHIANDLRVVSSRTRYPWEEMSGATPLSKDMRRLLRERWSIGAWNGMGGIYGTAATVAASRKAIRAALRGICKPVFFDEHALKRGQQLTAFLKHFGLGAGLRAKLDAAKPVFDLLKGVPSPCHLAGAAWRCRTPENAAHDPLQRRCGLLWLSPIVPMTGDSALELNRLIAPIFETHGFEPLVTLTAITTRALCSVISISYDKQNAEECERAQQCYSALFEACMQRGYIPYRCGIQSMSKLGERSETFWNVSRKIKEALDPGNIIAPGRYLPAV